MYSPVNLDIEIKNKIISCIHPTVSEDIRLNLDRSFDHDEIILAIKSMHPNKAPGPDGVHAIFYQRFWDVAGDDFINVCLDFLNNNVPMGNINHTHIALSLKYKNPRNLNNFRLVNLCNVIYKVISKAITNRLKTFMDDVISLNQSAFIPSRFQ